MSKNLVWNPTGKKLLDGSKWWWDDNINMDLGLCSTCSRQDQMAGFCKHINGTSGSI